MLAIDTHTSTRALSADPQRRLLLVLLAIVVVLAMAVGFVVWNTVLAMHGAPAAYWPQELATWPAG